MGKLGKTFFLLTIAMVESESPPIHEECCSEKVVGGVSYSLFHDIFHGSIPHQCLNSCVYTRSGTSSPKFCFQRGDLPTECLAKVPVALVGGEGPWEGNVMILGTSTASRPNAPISALSRPTSPLTKCSAEGMRRTSGDAPIRLIMIVEAMRVLE